MVNATPVGNYMSSLEICIYSKSLNDKLEPEQESKVLHWEVKYTLVSKASNSDKYANKHSEILTSMFENCFHTDIRVLWRVSTSMPVPSYMHRPQCLPVQNQDLADQGSGPQRNAGSRMLSVLHWYRIALGFELYLSLPCKGKVKYFRMSTRNILNKYYL